MVTVSCYKGTTTIRWWDNLGLKVIKSVEYGKPTYKKTPFGNRRTH